MLFLLLFVMALINRVSAWQTRRMDALRFPHFLQACERAASVRDGSPLRVTLGKRGEWHVERQEGQVKWFLSGDFLKAGFNQAFYCEAVEAGNAFQVTWIESTAWWTPPPF